MTTYYGVWSGEEWWCLYRFGVHELFHTAVIGIARATAMIANARSTVDWRAEEQNKHWKARAIGEDGLPAPSAIQETFDVKRDFLQCKMAHCSTCGRPAKEWIDIHIRGWVCERHNDVKLGCLSEKEG